MDKSSARSLLDQATIAVDLGASTPPHGCTVTGGALSTERLAGADQQGSILRGGDGIAAAFQGGWVTIQPGPQAQAQGERHELSLYLRVRDPSDRWDAPLLCEYDPQGRTRFALFATASAIVFELYTDWHKNPLRLEAAMSVIGGTAWHDLLVRYTGPHLELFVDGALVDEEWPIGALPGRVRGKLLLGAREQDGKALAGFRGLMDHVAVWDRVLTDPEIEMLCGGAAAVAARGWSLEEPSDRVQYRHAAGGGFVGDCLPFFLDGIYHFYHLFDRRHHGSKFGLGAHQWAHASSRDLVHWQHHPLAIPITEEREGSICTGSVFHHEGTWYGFYATRLPDRSEHLSLATSPDGIHFTKTQPNPFASPQPPYRRGPFRDPHVFRDAKTGLFHMMVTAELEHPPVQGRGGCLAHLVSKDLRHWEQKEPFLVTGYGDQPECSELYLWRGWYYLVFSHFGLAHYRMARDPFGPWTKPALDVLDGPLHRVMKSAGFTGDRRIGAFFMPEGAGWGGRSVFRELVQHPDGTLGTRWPPEMIPATGEPVAARFTAMGPGATGSASRIRLESPQGFTAAALASTPRNLHLSFTVTPTPGTYLFGVTLRAGEDLRKALSLEFEPSRRKLGWRAGSDHAWKESEAAALYQVDGLDAPFSVEVLVIGDVFDVCIGGQRTLINYQIAGDGDRLLFYCHAGEVTFEAVTVRPVLGSI